MVLVNTSVWIDFLRGKRNELQALLEEDRVLCHPYIIGELALGNLKDREVVLKRLRGLAQATLARDAEVLQLISRNSLFGTGIGYIDAHLLTSVYLTSDTSLLTNDKNLHLVATRSSLAFQA